LDIRWSRICPCMSKKRARPDAAGVSDRVASAFYKNWRGALRCIDGRDCPQGTGKRSASAYTITVSSESTSIARESPSRQCTASFKTLNLRHTPCRRTLVTFTLVSFISSLPPFFALGPRFMEKQVILCGRFFPWRKLAELRTI
jgi:hypothetical protein